MKVIRHSIIYHLIRNIDNNENSMKLNEPKIYLHRIHNDIGV